MANIRLDKADWQVLQAYGRTMLSIQLFELSVKGLAQLAVDVDEEVPFNTAWAELNRKVFMRAAGQLVEQLGLDDDLEKEVRDVVKRRNEIAHDYLWNYRFGRAIGEIDWKRQVAWLRQNAQRFESTAAKVEELCRRAQIARGWDPDELPLSVRDLRRALREE